MVYSNVKREKCPLMKLSCEFNRTVKLLGLYRARPTPRPTSPINNLISVMTLNILRKMVDFPYHHLLPHRQMKVVVIS